MPGCVMTQALMDIIKKEFPFDKFELKDELMSSCSSFLMFVMSLFSVNEVGGQRSLQPNVSSPLHSPKSSISP